MQNLDGLVVYSATDLVGYLECEHLTTLERAAIGGLVDRPKREDPELEVLQERGMQHEQRYLEYLRQQGRTVADGRHPPDSGERLSRLQAIEGDALLTRQRMAEGAEVIYQATLFDGGWLGYADFLLRVPGASNLGDYHYEVADTKLARRVKGGAILQMCLYSYLLAQHQGRMPEKITVALGGSGHRVEAHRLDDYLAYFRSVKGRFEAAVAAGQPIAYPLPVTPEPVDHCGVCRWSERCALLRRNADHLSLVAGIRTDQVKRLTESGIGTFTALATLVGPLPAIPKVSEIALAALHQQADLQHRSINLAKPVHEFLPIEAGRGLAGLPAPSPSDLFFDMEGDPFAEEDGLEYLFGVWDPAVLTEAGQPTFRDWWGHSRSEEKIAFEGFIDFVMGRWRADPTMHVYHYAAYERGRMGMLSTRHATREAEVDQMLRDGLFIDLYAVVRQGLRIGVPGYSIKKLEPLYALERVVPLKDAGSSIVAYERYIRSVIAGAPDHDILAQIRDYNQDDCRSNAELRDWLEERRRELEAHRGEPLPRHAVVAEPDKPPSEQQRRLLDLANRLLENVSADATARIHDPEAQARWLLANLLEWHHREEKAEWWAYYERCAKSDDELVGDEDAIGQLHLVGEVGRSGRSIHYQFGFDPEQPYRLKEGDEPHDPRTARYAGTIVSIDPLAGILELKRAGNSAQPRPTSLIPSRPLTADPQKGSLERIGTWVVEHPLDGPGPYRAARELLLGLAPRLGQAPGATLVSGNESIVEAARRLVLLMDGTALPVQGPPGSGKTWAGAEMILELVRAGRKVGIVAFTHRAIINLLDEVLEHAALAGMRVAAIRKLESGEEAPDGSRYRSTTDSLEVAEALTRDEVQIAAGTAWVWARSQLADTVDTLFVDEAGQMSLANVVAVSSAARNVVLLGDPQQLSQVKKGAHPEGADLSSLEHVLGGEPVIDRTRGLFLAETWRLHPDVNAFTSPAFYKGELRSAPGAAGQSVDAPGPVTGTGVRWIAIEHAGNHNSSSEEADVIEAIYGGLMEGTWTDHHGQQRLITPDDVLVIAPYNAQVELLTERLRPLTGPVEPTVATVDKIQGQQGAVAIYSMTTSSQAEMPRAFEFLYSLNRLNVATSRGRCLAVVVAAPDLLKVRVHTPIQMRMANALCRFVEISAEQAAPKP